MSDDKPHYDTCNKKTQLNLLLLKKAIVISHSVFQAYHSNDLSAVLRRNINSVVRRLLYLMNQHHL